jgi:hypothetical protein
MYLTFLHIYEICASEAAWRHGTGTIALCANRLIFREVLARVTMYYTVTRYFACRRYAHFGMTRWYIYFQAAYPGIECHFWIHQCKTEVPMEANFGANALVLHGNA